MKYIKAPIPMQCLSRYKSFVLVFGLLVLSGCANFNQMLSTTTGNQIDHKSVVADGEVGTQAAPQLSPFEQKVADLKARPNVYFSASPQVDESVKYQFNQALQAKNNKQFDLAKQRFTALTKMTPNLSGPWLHLGDIKLLERENVGADQWQANQDVLLASKALYEKAVDANHANYFAHNRLAKVYRELGRFEQAERHYKLAIASWPAYANAYLNLGILYDLYLGNKQQALEHYEIYQALQNKPIRQIRGWIADLQRQLPKAPVSASNDISQPLAAGAMDE
ncbi:tetratricopeptide repeat protein [Aliiglaciecola sp. LCG003]|uniref:tetratricopeptide repeat protein n=1 Tax=Aliiglaciecola sp. LCG003 TaxID=3053655 RepID=UPI0025728097|nr:tetratricopeptide repeat protein [Aliiglaciecola sp. LCG003]WJG08753.1 tetratricopeptide repeat protein [Aliiglaciecola sp. LCG003]